MALSVPPPTSTALGPPRRGAGWSRALARRILTLIGWRVDGGLPPIPRFVLIVAPHTSNWDFPVGVFAMFAIGMQATWLGKHTLFRFPVNGLLRWLGGEPVNRTASHGMVEAAVARFREREQWIVVISPEGTRTRVERWKTGFHRIAQGAGVPVVPVSFDWAQKVVTIMPPVWTTEDAESDIARFRTMFHAGMAKHPESFAEG
jgi:1-acyl-sn-glycerol-3-phosphate acyltransferase